MNFNLKNSSTIRWFLELMIVFIGVFSAFQLSEYKAERQANERREQIKQAVIEEIEDIVARTRRASDNIPKMVQRYDSLITAGKMPALTPITEPIRVNNHMWQATLQTGGLDLLDVPTMIRISEFYNMLNAGFAQLAQLRQLSETILIPNLNHSKDEFYDLKTKKIQPKYEWYINGLNRAAFLAKEITVLGDSLISDLKI